MDPLEQSSDLKALLIDQKQQQTEQSIVRQALANSRLKKMRKRPESEKLASIIGLQASGLEEATPGRVLDNTEPGYAEIQDLSQQAVHTPEPALPWYKRPEILNTYDALRSPQPAELSIANLQRPTMESELRPPPGLVDVPKVAPYEPPWYKNPWIMYGGPIAGGLGAGYLLNKWMNRKRKDDEEKRAVLIKHADPLTPAETADAVNTGGQSLLTAGLALPVLLGLGGAGIGAIRAPHGHIGEGAGRGATRGAATGLGAGIGGGLGAMTGGGIGALAAMQLANDKPALARAVVGLMGAVPGALFGGSVGGLAGGATGYGLSGLAMGNPSWEEEEEKKRQRSKYAALACTDGKCPDVDAQPAAEGTESPKPRKEQPKRSGYNILRHIGNGQFKTKRVDAYDKWEKAADAPPTVVGAATQVVASNSGGVASPTAPPTVVGHATQAIKTQGAPASMAATHQGYQPAGGTKAAFLIPAWGGGSAYYGPKRGIGVDLGYSYLGGLVPKPDIGIRGGTENWGVGVNGPLPGISIDNGRHENGWQWNSLPSVYAALSKDKGEEEPEEDDEKKPKDKKKTEKKAADHCVAFIQDCVGKGMTPPEIGQAIEKQAQAEPWARPGWLAFLAAWGG